MSSISSNSLCAQSRFVVGKATKRRRTIGSFENSFLRDYLSFNSEQKVEYFAFLP